MAQAWRSCRRRGRLPFSRAGACRSAGRWRHAASRHSILLVGRHARSAPRRDLLLGVPGSCLCGFLPARSRFDPPPQGLVRASAGGPSDLPACTRIVHSACGNLHDPAHCQCWQFDAKPSEAGFCDMAFKAHCEPHGPRLWMIRRLGPPGLARAVGSAAAPSAVRQAPVKKAKGKGGRPRQGRPWEAEDPPVSRRTWERRRKKAAEANKPKGRSPRGVGSEGTG